MEDNDEECIEHEQDKGRNKKKDNYHDNIVNNDKGTDQNHGMSTDLHHTLEKKKDTGQEHSQENV